MSKLRAFWQALRSSRLAGIVTIILVLAAMYYVGSLMKPGAEKYRAACEKSEREAGSSERAAIYNCMPAAAH